MWLDLFNLALVSGLVVLLATKDPSTRRWLRSLRFAIIRVFNRVTRRS